MKFLHGLIFGLCLSFIAAYFCIVLLDRYVDRAIVRTIQKITAPPTAEELANTP